jgi:hypothetical protein
MSADNGTDGDGSPSETTTRIDDQTRTLVDVLLVASLGGVAAGVPGVLAGCAFYALGASYTGRWNFIEVAIDSRRHTSDFDIDIGGLEDDIADDDD